MISDKNGIYNFFGFMQICMEDKLRLIKNAGFDCVYYYREHKPVAVRL